MNSEALRQLYPSLDEELREESRAEIAHLVDEVSNRLQVVLGFAQILRDLDGDERDAAVDAIGRECAALHEALASLTRLSRDSEGEAPWSSSPDQAAEAAPSVPPAPAAQTASS